MEQAFTCPKCQSSIEITDFFCRICGYHLKDKPLSTAFFKQISIYLVSFFIPPFGLIPAIKYIRQEDNKSKQVGIIAIVITFISIMISIWLLQNFLGSLNQILNGQLGTYENLSF